MKLTALIILTLLFCLIFHSCSLENKVEVKVSSNDTMFIYVKQKVLNDKYKFVLQLDSIIEDSRCPEGAECIWAGNAKAKFNLNVNDKFEYINGLNYNVSVISKNWPYMSFYYDDPQVYDEEYSITFKEGIGIYKWISGWGIGERLVKSELK